MIFKRVEENFLCEKCGADVFGDGYTNHCPKCLTAKHVDDKGPGDRESLCGGLMTAIAIEIGKGGEAVIVHKCEKCGVVRRCRRAENDSDEVIISIAKKAAELLARERKNF